MTSTNVNSLLSLRGQVALITGASGHLGQAMASALAEAGASVVVTSRDAERSQVVASKLPSVDGAVHYGVELDHMREESIESGFQAAVEKAGKIDILINNGHEGIAQDWKTVTGEQFSRQMGNLSGYFLLARAFHQHVTSRKVPGSLVLIGSMYGVVGSYPETYEGICTASPVAYHALKGGVVQMTRHLAVYWAADGVRVNCLSPGPFPGQGAPGELVERLKQRSPMKRMGKPEELKGAVVFLASQASSYMTGQNLVIDGGWTAW